MKKKKRIWIRVVILVVLILMAGLIVWPKEIQVKIPKPNISFQSKAPFVGVKFKGDLVNFKINYNIKRGLDLQGGSRLVYVADLSKISTEDKNNAMDSLKKVIENRINAFGVAEPVIQTTKSGDEYRLIVELPGVKNTDEALQLIGKTATLVFKELGEQDFKPTTLTGKDLKRSDVAFDPNTGAPYISLQFNAEGSKKFEELTTRNVGKPIGISLDEEIISAPKVNEKISGGKAQITGEFTFDEAKALVVQLNAGALPAPIKMVEQRTIEATLGQESVSKSLVAGILGIFLVSIFMIVYFRLLGIFSVIGLFLYILFSLAIFKVIGITLTMGGVAAFILSIGMSMETDVLVFERIREELRRGATFLSASRLGFVRAWPSIRDSNFVSLIIAAILYWLGQSTIKGFAIILAIGIVVGLATTFLGTRTLIDLIAKRKFVRNNWLFRVEKTDGIEDIS